MSRIVLLLLCAAQFVVVLDVTVVAVALPSVQADLGFAASGLQWVVTGYALAYGGLLLLGGRAADALGARRTFLAGLGLFTTASLACGLAASPEALVAARVVQGAGAALLSPAALSLLLAAFPPGPARHRALAAWGAVGAAGAVAGVLAGGVLTEAFGWSSVFLVNVPVGVAVAAGALRVLPSPAPRPSSLDPRGALALTGGVGALLYALAQAPEDGWGAASVLVPAAAGLVALALAHAAERRTARPLVPATVLRRRPLVAGTAVMLLASGLMVGVFFLCSQQLQRVLGASALETGLAFLPAVLAVGAAAHGARHVIGRHGAKAPLVGGLLAAAAGLGLLAAADTAGPYAASILPGLVLAGFGLGLTFVCVTVTAMADAEEEHGGVSSGLLTTAHELGAAFGVGVVGTVAAAASALPAGLGDAYALAAGAALAGAAAVAVVLRGADVAPDALGERPAFAH